MQALACISCQVHELHKVLLPQRSHVCVCQAVRHVWMCELPFGIPKFVSCKIPDEVQSKGFFSYVAPAPLPAQAAVVQGHWPAAAGYLQRSLDCGGCLCGCSCVTVYAQPPVTQCNACLPVQQTALCSAAHPQPQPHSVHDGHVSIRASDVGWCYMFRFTRQLGQTLQGCGVNELRA